MEKKLVNNVSALLLNEACIVLDGRAITVGILCSFTLYGMYNILALVQSVSPAPLHSIVNLLPDYALHQTCMLIWWVLGDPWLVVRCVRFVV